MFDFQEGIAKGNERVAAIVWINGKFLIFLLFKKLFR